MKIWLDLDRCILWLPYLTKAYIKLRIMVVKLYGDKEEVIQILKFHRVITYSKVFTYLEVLIKKDNLRMISGLLNLTIKNANRF